MTLPGTTGFLHWLGRWHPSSQSGFLKELSAEVSRPTIMTHRYSPITDSDHELSHPTYCRPQASLSFFTCFPIGHVIPAIMLSNMVHNPSLLATGPPPPSGSPLSFLVWGFHPWYIMIRPSLPTQPQDLISRMRDPRPQTWTPSSEGQKWGERVSDSPEAHIIMVNNWESN